MADSEPKMTTNSKKPADEEVNIEEKLIAGPEMKAILKECGKTVPQFAKFLGKSESYVRATLGHMRTNIPLTYADALKVFVGDVNYKVALDKIRNIPITDL